MLTLKRLVLLCVIQLILSANANAQNISQFVNEFDGFMQQGSIPADQTAIKPTQLEPEDAKATKDVTSSFACDGNLLPAEAVICSDRTLAALDQQLANNYTTKLRTLRPDERANLRASQQRWLAERNQCRVDKACLVNVYQDRIRSLGEAPTQSVTHAPANILERPATISPPPPIAQNRVGPPQASPLIPSVTAQNEVETPKATPDSQSQTAVKGERGWIGVRLQQVTDDLVSALSLNSRRGALVASVEDAGPAKTAGIMRGDVIITFDGHDIKTIQDLPVIVGATPIEKEVEVVVIRQTEERRLNVKVGRLAQNAQGLGSEGSIEACRAALTGPPTMERLLSRGSDFQRVLTELQDPKIQEMARTIASSLAAATITSEDVRDPVTTLTRLAREFSAQLQDSIRRQQNGSETEALLRWLPSMTDDERVACFPDLRRALIEYSSRGHAFINSENQKALDAAKAAQQAQREADATDEAIGYRHIAIETFLLDGKDMANDGTKIAITGAYTHEGNSDYLLPNAQAVGMRHNGVTNQPTVPLLVDEASRDFRELLLQCQYSALNSYMGCKVTVVGRVSSCTVTSAFGVERKEPCLAVEGGRRLADRR